ncbi:succinate dehydrogenase cytochrome b subunit [Pedobacter sp. SD-b]|uniref:Succinate dehydrogenase cytochrome b subunit n=1 Tax=Pedobacter segetis TaxID=2793069 RepID=A0ABS1BIQ4_9SPHI|nr:succinate dehydrogenase cytochrome b subunit [Pedobacter segetis]MBK0382241.1 succinate dehydrogenase cytochrome b subunit [Pedobacter segetis]
MSNFSSAFSSTLGRKLVMCLTGLFLCSFLIVHLAGNFQLFKNDDGLAFNQYAHFMTHFTPIKVVSYLLYSSIIIHTIWAIVITLMNRKARPISYAIKPKDGSIWSSRNMGILGTILFVFIVVHMANFWYKYHSGETPYIEYRTDINSGATMSKSINESEFTEYVSFVDNGVQVTKSEDLYKEVSNAFQQWWLVIFYVLAMAALAFHLVHGFQSAFQTLGWNHHKYRPLIKFIGLWVFSIGIPLGFAAMPIYLFLFK